MNNQEFDHIIKQCLAQEREAQKTLFENYCPYVLSITLRYADNRSDAEELLNDVFLKVFKGLDQHNREKKFKGWLRQITVRTCIDRYRKKLKQAPLVQLEVGFEGSVENDYLEKISAEEIIANIQKLAIIQRTVFNLYEIEGYSHEEIATQLKIKPSSSRSILSRAKQKLQASLLAEKKIEYYEAG